MIRHIIAIAAFAAMVVTWAMDAYAAGAATPVIKAFSAFSTAQGKQFATNSHDTARIIGGLGGSGSGTPTPTFANLSTAAAQAAGAPTTVFITGTNVTRSWHLPANFEVVPVNGGTLQPAAGTTLTYAGSTARWPMQQVIDSSVGGAVAGLRISHPEWWGTNTAPGVTNMSAAVASSFASSNGKVILSDVYGVTGNQIIIDHNLDIEFIGNGKLKAISTTASHQIITITSAVTSCRITNANIDLAYSARTYQPQAIYVNGAAGVTIDNPSIYNSGITRTWPVSTGWGYGVYLNNAWSNVVINNPSLADLNYGVITNRNNTAGAGLWINGGTIHDCSADAVEIDAPTTGAHDIYLDGVTIERIGSNDITKGMGFGTSGAAAAYVYNVKVTNCTFRECDLQGVHIEDGSREVVVSGNLFYNNGEGALTTNGGAMYITAGGAANRAIGNIIVSDNIVIGRQLSDLEMDLGGVYSNGVISVSGNHVTGSGGVGMRIGSVQGRVNVYDNIVSNSVGIGINFLAFNGKATGNNCYDDQTVKTQTYGIGIGPTGYNTVIRDNIISDNINNGFYLPALTYPRVISSDSIRLTGITAEPSAWTSWRDIIYLGTGAAGTLYTNATSAASWTTSIFSIAWDGTTLAPAVVSSSYDGAITLIATEALRVSGGWLQARIFSGFGSAVGNITLEAKFDGTIMVK